MLTMAENFRSTRPDGRHRSSLAALMAELREMQPELAFRPEMDHREFEEWQKAVKAKVRELMRFPPVVPQPPPKLLDEAPRDGYRLQRWEFYPNRWTAVPFLLLIPDGAAAQARAPGVLCFPGSATSKELLAGEPNLPHPNCANRKFAERNAMAKHYVNAGMVAAVFDNPGTAELAEFNPPDRETQWQTRTKLVQGYLAAGCHYPGISVFQKLLFLEWFRKLEYLDAARLAVSGHSLGTETAMFLGLLCDEIKVVIYNDFLCDERRRYTAVTNMEPDEIDDDGNWHMIPGFWRWFGFSDLLAAVAPKYLSINEGGPDELIDKVRRAYAVNRAEERLAVHYYPRFARPESRPGSGRALPAENLTRKEFFEQYAWVDVPDHSFRAEPSLQMIKKAFGL